MYVYLQSEPRLWSAGHYDPSGKFHVCADFGTPAEAEAYVAKLNGGPPAPTPSAVVLDLAWWINNYEEQGRVYMEGVKAIQQDMELRDDAMRREVACETKLRTHEAGIVLAAMDGDDPIFDDCKNDRQREAALLNWKATEPTYIQSLAALNAVKRERSLLEASIRAKELACSIIKRDVEFATAVVNAMGRGL